MKVYVVELWTTVDMYREELEEYEIFLSLEDAQNSCITSYAMNDHEYIEMMDSNGACRRIITVDIGE